MQTIIIISTESLWSQSQLAGTYAHSTIESSLENVGFIHCTSPEQTVMIANRHFAKYDGLVLLLIDLSKVESDVKFEASLSGRAGVYPHIYGPLNVDAVYKVVKLLKRSDGTFAAPLDPLFQTVQKQK